jgi:ATP-dependent DNA helicase RecG
VSSRSTSPKQPCAPVEVGLAALSAPLAFAARDDFAHIDRVRGLEASVSHACRRLLDTSLPADLAAVLVEIETDFQDPAEAPQAERADEVDPRIARVRGALKRLGPFLEPGWAEAALAHPPSVFPGVGARRAEALAKRGLSTIEQLLFHLPVDYDDRRALVEVADLEVGRRATFLAVVQSVGQAMARTRGGRLGRVLEAVVGDATGSISLKWFYGGDALESNLRKDERVLVSGEVRRHRFSKQLIHPEVEFVGGDASSGLVPEPDGAADRHLEGLRRIVPRYTTPEGIPARTLRGLVERAVADYADLVVGYLPDSLVAERELPEPGEALRWVHAPPYDSDLEEYCDRASRAHQRLVLEELYLLELGLALRHAKIAELPGIALNVACDRVDAAADGLPFTLTGAQRRAWQEIRADLGRRHPMNRLLQGDVGSGKTAVAFLAAVAAAASGRQAALMAPTELLAEQHARTLQGLVASSSRALEVRIALLTASVPPAQAEATRRSIACGEIDLVIGTHALLQPDVDFESLAVVLVDEQHRFGVKQRQALSAKLGGGLYPHTLVMTATPIPRTLALTLYGDLDVSVIDELPPGRRPVKTLLLREGEGAAVTRIVGETLERGEQVYVVYPLVEESEKLDLRSAIESCQRITRAFPDVGVDLVHGRMEPGERQSAMRRFERGETRILVATTVIEVGVDVSRATLMVVEPAERFGLAQLHQLRGGVGRGDRPGACLLVSRSGALASDASERSEERLKAMLETTDGFEIANADLRIRGPGEFLGTRQSGHLPDLRIADLLRDQRLLAIARNAAFEIVRRDPGLQHAPALRAAVQSRWGERVALVGVA